MKTLKWIADTEVSVISMIKFIGDFVINCNTPRCITIKCFSNNNAKRIHGTFIDDCDSNCKDYLRNNITCEKCSEDDYVKFILDKDSNMSFSVTYKEGYTTVSVVLVNEIMRIR